MKTLIESLTFTRGDQEYGLGLVRLPSINQTLCLRCTAASIVDPPGVILHLLSADHTSLDDAQSAAADAAWGLAAMCNPDSLEMVA